MSARYFVEILSRNQELEQRFPFEALPIRLGRAYDNDVILDDPHTAAHHAQIELSEDGVLQIRDVDSRNGIIYQDQKRKTIALDGNRVMRLGQTHIRVRESHFLVEPEVVDANNYRWEGWRPALVALALILLQTIFSKRFAQVADFSLTVAIQYGLSMLLVLSIWSAIWSGATRLLTRQVRFGRHLFIAAASTSLIQVMAGVTEVISFALSWEWLVQFRMHMMLAIVAGQLYFHLRTVSNLHLRRKLWVVGSLFVVASSSLLMSNYKNTGRFSDELYMSGMYSPSLRISRNLSIEELSKNAEQLKAKVDRQRKDNVPSIEEDEE